MFLKRLELRNFRSYEALELDVETQLNFISGPNGSGKTGLLEAIYYLAETRTFKKAEDPELIRYGNEFLTIGADYRDKLGDHNIHVAVEAKSKSFTIDDVKKKSAVQVIGNLIVVAYEPSMVFLFKDEPGSRRKLLDETLSPIDSQYLYSLGRYKKYLRERNQAFALDYDPDVIDVLTGELIMSSYRIAQLRRRLIQKIDGQVNQIFKRLDKSEKNVRLFYKTNYPSADNLEDYIDKMKKAYDAKRSEEVTRKMTVIGIHRDDIEATLDDLNLGSSGSQGQNRLVTIAIKMATAGLIAEVTGSYPILLLDDIFSDLDDEHLKTLKSEFEKYPGQVFVTGCQPPTDLDKWNHFRINHKKIERGN